MYVWRNVTVRSYDITIYDATLLLVSGRAAKRPQALVSGANFMGSPKYEQGDEYKTTHG